MIYTVAIEKNTGLAYVVDGEGYRMAEIRRSGRLLWFRDMKATEEKLPIEKVADKWLKENGQTYLLEAKTCPDCRKSFTNLAMERCPTCAGKRRERQKLIANQKYFEKTGRRPGKRTKQLVAEAN